MSVNFVFSQNAAQNRQHTDTLSGSGTTYVYYPATGSYGSPFDWEFAATGANISGTTTAKVWIEVQPPGSTLWVQKNLADTINLYGTSSKGFLYGSLLGGRVRAKITTGTNTQSTQVKTSFIKQVAH